MMDRRTLLLLSFAFVLVRPQASLADDDESSGDESSSGDGGDDSSSPDGADTETDDSSNDNGDGGADGGGNDGATSGGDDSGPANSSGSTGVAVSDHEKALKAVQTDGVLSLEAFLHRFHQQVEGKVIDVALSKRRGRFVFTVTSIDSDGKVRRRQFDAQSGKLLS